MIIDEDNESLFGAWFEEVLTSGDQQIENASSKTQASDHMDLDKSVLNQSNYSVVPENDDPEGVKYYFVLIIKIYLLNNTILINIFVLVLGIQYLSLIIRIFNVLDIYFLSSECDYIFTYMSKTIQTDNLVVLAKLIREVDWAHVNNDLCK